MNKSLARASVHTIAPRHRQQLPTLLMMACAAALLGATVSPGTAVAQTQTQTAPPQPMISDAPYPGGELNLHVDATDIAHRIFRVHEDIPVAGAGPLRGLADQPQLVLQQRPRLVTHHLGPEVTQLAQRRSMKRSGLHAAYPEVTQSGAHLPRRARGECHREDLPRGDMAGVDQMGDPPGDGARLSGARSCQHADRSPGRTHRGALLVVETVQGIPISSATAHGGYPRRALRHLPATATKRYDA